MKQNFLVLLVLFASGLAFVSPGNAQNVPAVNTPIANWPAGGIPNWIKCTVTNSSTNLVVSGTGCLTGSTAKAAALTQSLPLFTLSANGFVHNYVLKSSTAFAGTTTLLAGLGTTGTPNLFLVSALTGYNLNAAVAVGNLSTLPPLAVGSDTASATNVVLSLTSTVSNISAISAGVVDVWVMWSVRP